MSIKTKKTSKRSFRLSSFDFVGEEFSFEFPTFSRKLQTKMGTCLNLVIGVICILATILIGSKYFDTRSPSVTFSNLKGPQISHNLLKELMLPPLAVYLEGSPLQADFSRLATIKAESVAFTFDRATNQHKTLFYEVSDFVNCKELNDPLQPTPLKNRWRKKQV